MITIDCPFCHTTELRSVVEKNNNFVSLTDGDFTHESRVYWIDCLNCGKKFTAKKDWLVPYIDDGEDW